MTNRTDASINTGSASPDHYSAFLNIYCFMQTLLKTAVLATRKSLDRDAPAPKTATQEAMQAQVSSAALQSDTLKASALAAEVSSAPQGAAPQAKQVVLLIHGGAQGGWVWSYPNEVTAHCMPMCNQYQRCRVAYLSGGIFEFISVCTSTPRSPPH